MKPLSLDFQKLKHNEAEMQSGIIGVRTCRLIFLGWVASIHHSIGTLTRCIDTWLCNGFASMVSARLGISCYTYMNVSNGCHSANNWPISYSTWLCNGFASMVSARLGICNVSCYTYMNVSNGCHSAKTTGQFCIARGFAMASHHWF